MSSPNLSPTTLRLVVESVASKMLKTHVLLGELGAWDRKKWFPDHVVEKFGLFDVGPTTLKRTEVRLQGADSTWDNGTSNSGIKCQVTCCDMAPQTTMSTCQGI